MRTLALILRKQHTKEYDQLITCYTQEMGKVLAIAKSSLKPTSVQGAQLDPLNIVDFELIDGRTAPIITGAHLEQAFRGVRSSLPKLAVAQFFLEAAGRMIFEHERDDRLWDFFLAMLTDLEQASPERILPIFRTYQLRLLTILGYTPHTERCGLCSSKDQNGWALSLELGGLICQNCFQNGTHGLLLTEEEQGLLRRGEGTTALEASVLDTVFEYTASSRFHSLTLLYSLPKKFFYPTS